MSSQLRHPSHPYYRVSPYVCGGDQLGRVTIQPIPSEMWTGGSVCQCSNIDSVSKRVPRHKPRRKKG